MGEIIFYAVGGALLLCFLAGFIFGNSGESRTWDSLVNAFGVEKNPDHRDSDPARFGTMELLGVRIAGEVRLNNRGILFRRDNLRGFEIILFPWTQVVGLESSESAKTANFALKRVAEPTEAVTIPWSADLERQKAKLQLLGKLNDE